MFSTLCVLKLLTGIGPKPGSGAAGVSEVYLYLQWGGRWTNGPFHSGWSFVWRGWAHGAVELGAVRADLPEEGHPCRHLEVPGEVVSGGGRALGAEGPAAAMGPKRASETLTYTH